MSLVRTFVSLVQSMGVSMTAPTLANLVTVVTGWLFSGRRTVTGMLLAAGAVKEGERKGAKHHSAYHRLFATARWSVDVLGLAVFRLVAPLIPPGTVPLNLDDTLARKRGLKTFGTGMHHDPLASSRKVAVVAWGHCWVVLAVRIRVPCLPNKYFSLPILFRLYLNRSEAAKWRLAYRTKPELAVELLKTFCVAHPERRFHAFADSAYGGQSVLAHLPINCDLTSRLPLDARLYGPPPERKPGTRGRPRKRGRRRDTPKQMLLSRARRVTLDLYARHDRVRLAETVAYWHSVPNRPLHVVVVQPLVGGRETQAFYSTCLTQTAEELLGGYSGRWSIEETFEGSKQILGFEEPQGWSKWAVLRTAPMAMLLYSLVVLWFAQHGHSLYRPLHRPWYVHKSEPSFADMVATLKRESLWDELFTQLPALASG